MILSHRLSRRLDNPVFIVLYKVNVKLLSNMDITIHAILIWITAIVITSLDIVIVIGSKNLSSRVFALLSFITAIWVVSQGFLVSTFSVQFSDLLIRIQYLMGLSIALGFHHFSAIYPYDRRPKNILLIISVLIVIFFAYLYLFTNTLITGATYIGGIGKWSWGLGPLHLLFELVFCALWILALLNLYKTYAIASGTLKLNLRNMFWGLLLGIIPPTVCNILLPAIGYFRINWFGPVSSAIWIFIIAYSILRYRQMNVRTVITEVLAIAMTAIFFINIFIEEPLGTIGRVFIFLVFLILATYLIRGALRESRQREELKTLNSTLSEKVAEQTAEIRRAFELEKHARRELEKLNETKDQFIMITQHHLRTPVTNIRYEVESMLKGTYGAVAPELRQGLEETNTAVARLMRIADDFLGITTLKAGAQILNTESASMQLLLDDVLAEMKPEIEAMRLSIDFPHDRDSWPMVMIDIKQTREVLLIIIENAVRYNEIGGTIHISNSVVDGMYKMTIENTGIGLAAEETKNVFGKLFYRGDRAKAAHPVGMGIGLSVARSIMRAYHGDITIESKGVGHGAKVTLKTPVA